MKRYIYQVKEVLITKVHEFLDFDINKIRYDCTKGQFPRAPGIVTVSGFVMLLAAVIRHSPLWLLGGVFVLYRANEIRKKNKIKR